MTSYLSIDQRVNKIWIEFTDLVPFDTEITITHSKVIEFPNGSITNIIIEIDFETSESFDSTNTISFPIKMRIENEVQTVSTLRKDGRMMIQPVEIIATPATEAGEPISDDYDTLTINMFPFTPSGEYSFRHQFFYETKN